MEHLHRHIIVAGGILPGLFLFGGFLSPAAFCFGGALCFLAAPTLELRYLVVGGCQHLIAGHILLRDDRLAHDVLHLLPQALNRVAGLPIGRGIRKAELNLHLGSKPGEVLLALVFALAAVQVVELLAGSCQLALQLCGLLLLAAHGFGGAFCCNGLLNLKGQRLLVVSSFLTQTGYLLVK